MKREMPLDRIAVSLELFVAFLQGRNDMSRFDINTLSEDLFANILNTTYNANFKNENVEIDSNAISIDLTDNEQRMAFQVTSTNTKDKIRTTIQKFEKSRKYERFDRLRFLILDRAVKPRTLDDLKRANGWHFDPQNDILSIGSLLKTIRSLPSIEKVEAIDRLLIRELPFDRFLGDEMIDDAIMRLLTKLTETELSEGRRPSMDLMKVGEKIRLNFHTTQDRKQIAREYELAMSRFNLVDQLIEQVYTSQEAYILQSSMYYMYNELKLKSKTNMEIIYEMIRKISRGLSYKPSAAEKVAARIIVLYHFDDCTILEQTAQEKQLDILGGN